MTQGAFNGMATIQWASGGRYDGQLVNGSLTGRGTTRSPDGTVSSGTFKNSQLVDRDPPPTSIAPTTAAASNNPEDSGFGTALSVLGAITSTAGQGLAGTDTLRSAQLSALGNTLSQVGESHEKGRDLSVSGSSNPSSYATGGSAGSISAEVSSVDLSGGCQAAQQKGEAYVKRSGERAKTQNPGVCISAREIHKIGEITVRVADLCHEIQNWQDLRAQGEQMMRESEETMRGSCG